MIRAISGAVLLGLAMLLGTADTARADCYRNGELVPEGTRIGGLVCTDGQWQPG
jgi:hypothetical protein